MIFKPHSYQEYAISRIVEDKTLGLFLDMGLGKTVITLTAIDELMYNYFDVQNVLVIAPLRVAQSTWGAEVKKWDHLKHLHISKVLGSEKARKSALIAKADIYIINRENVEWLVNEYGNSWPFDMVVVDELSSFKSTKAIRFKKLRWVRPFITRIVGLTGTPAPNSLLDLWPQVFLLDKGERLGKTISAYKDRYFNPGARDGYMIYTWIPKPEAEARIYEKIGDICVSMQGKDHLILPERVDNTIVVELPEKALNRYKELERDLLLPYTDGDVVANTAAVLSNKLLQLANGAIYDEFKGVKYIHDEKLYALADIIEAANGKSVLVFYWYKHDLERLLKAFPKAVTLTDESKIVDWNKGEIELLLVHPASAGHGLNLQDGGHNIVWFGLTWSLELYQQANARLYRQGQKRSVVVHHLVAQWTIDEEVMRALERKEGGQSRLLEAVKARIRSV